MARNLEFGLMPRLTNIALGGFTLTIALAGSALALDSGTCSEMKASFGSSIRIGAFGAAGCSGVMISDRAFLTAAHCFPKGTTSRSLRLHTQKRGTTVTPCITLDGSGKCTALNFRIRQHSSWTGSGDTEDDIALVVLRDSRAAKLRYSNGPIPSSDFSRLYNDVWHRSKTQKRAGFGPCNNNGAGDDKYRETNIKVDKWHDYHYRFRAKIGNRQCHGDSGGPAWLRRSHVSRPILVGLASNSEKFNENTCAQVTRWQRWVKISPKTQWISNTLKSLSGRGCRAPHTNPDGIRYLLCFD